MTTASRATGVAATALLALGVLLASPAAAARDLGHFGHWFAETHAEKHGTVCSMWSRPLKEQGDYSRRGKVFAFVSDHPARRRFDEFFIETGYTYRKGSEVTARIDGNKSYKMLTAGSTAWALSRAEAARIIRAMRSGRKMVVVGTSSRGTRTTDTYSLKGFTAAHDAIAKACKAPR